MPLIDPFLFTAEITVLFFANRQWNTLEIVCSGASRLWQTNVNKQIREEHKFPTKLSVNLYWLESWTNLQHLNTACRFAYLSLSIHNMIKLQDHSI